jgi:hypothetical protein
MVSGHRWVNSCPGWHTHTGAKTTYKAWRAALLLRFLFPECQGPETPDAHFAHPPINKALGLKPEYVYEGVDLLGRRFDEMLRQTESRGAA